MARRRSRGMQLQLRAAFILLAILLAVVGPALGSFILGPMLAGAGLPVFAAAFVGTVFAEAMAIGLVVIIARR